jgi:hypothetical protein
MADDTTQQDNRDRSKVAGGQDYEVQYLATKTGISIDQARELVRKHGNNRETLEREARKLA